MRRIWAALFLFLSIAGPASAEERKSTAPDFFGGPVVGSPAPEFSLKDLVGREIQLSSFKKKKPVVLITGSYSCPIFRESLAGLERLYDRYHTRAEFFILYTIEAHPKGAPSPYAGKEWVTSENERDRILLPQPSSYEERVGTAAWCRTALGSDIPILVDEMDDAVWTQYGRAPNAAYLIDSEGKVQIRQGWFDPIRFEQAFLDALQEESPRW